MGEQQERTIFLSRFSQESKEILALTQEYGGCGRSGSSTLWEMTFPTLGVIDLNSGQLSTDTCQLCWQLTEAERQTKEQIFDLQSLSVYRLRVQESLPTPQLPQGRYLWVTEVLERDCQDTRLTQLLTAYQTPVILEIPGCSPLVLDKSLNLFCGEGQWAGKNCLIHLEADASQTADAARSTLQSLLADCTGWDQKARRFAASMLAECANDWQDDEEDTAEITEDEFAARISISEISICAQDGAFELYYDDDDLFWGHVIIVSGNLEDGFSDAAIAG
ncbi:MAG: DUF2262 domain-containing protein [Butyricicoccus pullicaecorum]|nr:DUF2262 domain-containing protein [Butyricicoccus pullicaecorum]